MLKKDLADANRQIAQTIANLQRVNLDANDKIEIFTILNRFSQEFQAIIDGTRSQYNVVSLSFYIETLIPYLQRLQDSSFKWTTEYFETDQEDFSILCSKFIAFNLSLVPAITMPSDDLYSLPSTSERWRRLSQIISTEVVGSAEQSMKHFNKFTDDLAVFVAFITQAFKYQSKIKVRVQMALCLAYYSMRRKAARRQMELFYANPNVDSIKMLWNMLDSPLGYKFFKFISPSVKVNQMIYVPRITKTALDFEDLHVQGPQHYISILSAHPVTIGSNFTFEMDQDQVRIPVRVICNSDILAIKQQKPIRQGLCCSSYTPAPRNIPIQFSEVIIHFHGGGFLAQTSSSHINYTIQWSKAFHIPVLSVDYRLAPENKFPCALDDCWEVYNWVLKYGRKYLGITPSKIILGGDSAGGNLAIGVALRAIVQQVRAPDGLILSYPAVNMNKNSFSPSLMHALEDKLIPSSFLRLVLDSYLGDSDPLDFTASPIYTPDEILRQFPKTRILVCERDPISNDAVRLIERLDGVGVDVKGAEFKGFIHGALGMAIKGGVPEAQAFVDKTIEFIREMLGDQGQMVSIMFCLVSYGYRQTGIFNIDCQVAPLLSAIIRQANAEINKLMNQKDASFSKEIQDILRRTDNLRHRLHVLDNPTQEEEARQESMRKKFEDEQIAAALLEQKQMESPREEEKKKGKKEVAKKGKADAKKDHEEEKKLSPEEQVRKIVDTEKEELRRTLDEQQHRLEKLSDKVRLIREIRVRFAEIQGEFDLVDTTGARKFLRTRQEEDATSVLNTRTTYVLAQVKEDDTTEPYKFDGYCIRTPEEDDTYVEEPVETKKPARGGKKK